MDKQLAKILDQHFEEPIEKTYLENGLKLISKSCYNAKLFSLQAWVKTGSICESPWLGSGISHYVEHMLFKGTQKRNYKQISEVLHQLGCHVNAYTTFDRTVYYIDGPIESLETAFDVLSDILFHSTFPKEEIQKEQSVILREIDMGLDDPDRQLFQTLFRTAFKQHPYQYPIIGEKNIFKQLQPKDLLNYYKERYIPSNITLIAVASLPKESIESLTKKYFASQKATLLKTCYIPEEPDQLSHRTFYAEGNYELVRGVVAYPIPSLYHEDSVLLTALSHTLGQGKSSHLWQTLREKEKLVHSICASIWNPGSNGLLIISYTCSKGKRIQVEKAIEKELATFLHKPFSKSKIEKFVTQAVVGEVNSRKTISAQASKIGFLEVVVGDLNYPRAFINNLKKITSKSLKEIQKKYLLKEKCISVALEPKEKKEVKKTPNLKPAQAIPDFKEIRLENGVRLLLQPFPTLPKVHFRIGMLGGPMFEDPKRRGITSILATLLTKDTKKHSASKIAEHVEAMGASFSEFSGNNSFGLALEVLSKDVLKANHLLEAAVKESVFKKGSFEVELENQKAAIKEELDEITEHGMRLLRKHFFGAHPHSSDPLGELKTIDNISLQALNLFKNQLIQPQNLVLAVSGDFEQKSVEKMLTGWLSTLTAHSKTCQKPHYVFQGPNPGLYTKKLPKEQVVIYEAYPTVGAIDELLEVSELVEELLSGMSSPLFIKVREEQGLAYFIGANRMLGVQTGMFYLYAGTNQKSYKQVQKAFEVQINKLLAGQIKEETLQKCKMSLKSHHRMLLQTASNRAMQVTLDTLYGLPTNKWRNYDEHIDAITPQHIQTFAQKFFTSDKRVRLTIGDIEK